MNTCLVRHWRLGIIALLAAGAAAYVRRVPWTPVIATMSHASFWLLALALCFHWLALSGKAGIWWIFLRPLGGPRFTTVARGTLVGATLNSLFVGSSGEAGRVVLMSRLTGIPSASVLATVVLERAVDLCGFLTLLAWAALLFPIPPAVGIGVCAALSIVATSVLARRLLGRNATRRAPGPAQSHSFAARCKCYVRAVFSSTRDIASTCRVSIAIALTLVDWCSELVSYSLVARAAGFPMGVRGSLVALLAVNVGFLVRVTPGNVGVFELVYATVARALGLPYELAIAIALMLHLVQDVPTALLGITFGMRLFSRESLPFAHPRSVRRPLTSTRPSSTAPYIEPARGTLP
jgi:glycosyltransferase 2 family protein